MELSLKQQLFVEEYLVDLNATQAAIRAGYAKKNADVTGPRLLGNVGIAKAIQEAFAARADRLGLTQDRVVQELMAIAFAAITDLASWNEDGELQIVRSDQLSPEAAAALKEVRSTTSTITFQEHERSTVYKAVKQHDKMRALELLGKHLGMFAERHKHEHSGTVGLTLSQLVTLAGEREHEPE